MRHTGFWARVLLLVAIALGAAITWGALQLRDGEETLPSVVVGVGLALLAIDLIVLVIVWKAVSLARRARRPDQRIASWTLSDETWAEFVAANLRREAETPKYQRVWKPRARAKGGEVIAAKGGLLIDGVFLGTEVRGMNRVDGMQWLQTRPECLEFSMAIVVSTGSSSRVVPGLFRVPVEPTQREQAITAYHYYAELLRKGQLSDPSRHRLVVRLALALAIVAAPLGGLGFWMNANGVMPNTMTPPLLAMVGSGVAVGSAFVALVVWLVMLRK